MSASRRNDSGFVFVLGCIVALVLVIAAMFVFDLGGDPGLPPCPKHHPHPTTVECH